MLGVYGGTFNPVHYGHLRTALEVKEIFALDEVRLIPCSLPPHRELPLETSEMRLKMLEFAVKGYPDLIVDRRELDREGFSYMIDTLKSLRIEISNTPLLLFLGMDAFEGLKLWHQWQYLFDYAHIVVMTRPGYEYSQVDPFFSSKLTDKMENLKREQSGYLFFQPVTQLDISATVIRNIIAEGLNPGFLLPDSVINYIKQNKLYKSVNANERIIKNG